MPIREPAWNCAACGYKMSAYSPMIGDAALVANDLDVSICVCCGMEYSRHGGRWVPMTKAERAALDPEARMLLNVARRYPGFGPGGRA